MSAISIFVVIACTCFALSAAFGTLWIVLCLGMPLKARVKRLEDREQQSVEAHNSVIECVADLQRWAWGDRT